jgi:hypothetical protein
MRDPLLKPTTSLSVLIPAHDEQHHIAPTRDRLNVRLSRKRIFGLWRIEAVNLLSPLTFVIADFRKLQWESVEGCSALFFRPESAWFEAAN